MAGPTGRVGVDHTHRVPGGFEFEGGGEADDSGTHDENMHDGTLPSYGGITRIRSGGRRSALSAHVPIGGLPRSCCDYKHEPAHYAKFHDVSI
ncbi:hypothetical protein GCM10027417_03900 [Glutamicibacter endophyticus]